MKRGRILMRTRQCTILFFIISIVILGQMGVVSSYAADRAALNSGLQAFSAGETDDAILQFRSILLDHTESEFVPDAYFWIARASMTASRLSEAQSNLETYLSRFAGHTHYEEAVYLKGRLLYLQGDFQEAIRQFRHFNERFPHSQYQANALYWTGESLLELGRLDEAERLFQAVLTHYPSSFRAEAARSRVDVLGALRRERRMADLLQWSHTELMRARNEFSAREQAYERALQRYREQDGTATEDALRAQIEGLIDEVRRLETQVTRGELIEDQELSARLRAVQLKERALEMKERYLDRLIQELEEG